MFDSKRMRGQYFTVSKNPFDLPAFRKWAERAQLRKRTVLEPFAGANDIISSLQKLDLCQEYQSFDLVPKHDSVTQRDTIESFPTGCKVCVTNPPWLARNSATRLGLPYPIHHYDDLYKYCLELCLNNCQFVAALVPASLLQSGLFRERLDAYVLLHDQIFIETENPVCLALFGDLYSEDTAIYYDSEYIGKLSKLESHTPQARYKRKIRFNDPAGQLGFISFDNIRSRSIRFCEIDEIEDYDIKVSSRFITRIGGEFDDVSTLIEELNEKIERYRDLTRDLFLTPFKGIRADGEYRRRMFFSLARRFINSTELSMTQNEDIWC